MRYTVVRLRDDEYLMHYRTKGSRNGHRQYQYEDGSLTPEGREHYGVGPARGSAEWLAKYGAKAKPTTPAVKQKTSKSDITSYFEKKKQEFKNKQEQKKLDKQEKKERKESEKKETKLREEDTREYARQNLEKMSNDDIRNALDRMKLEQDYKTAYADMHPSTKTWAKDLIRKAAIQSAENLAYGVTAGIKEGTTSMMKSMGIQIGNKIGQAAGEALSSKYKDQIAKADEKRRQETVKEQDKFDAEMRKKNEERDNKEWDRQAKETDRRLAKEAEYTEAQEKRENKAWDRKQEENYRRQQSEQNARSTADRNELDELNETIEYGKKLFGNKFTIGRALDTFEMGKNYKSLAEETISNTKFGDTLNTMLNESKAKNETGQKSAESSTQQQSNNSQKNDSKSEDKTDKKDKNDKKDKKENFKFENPFKDNNKQQNSNSRKSSSNKQTKSDTDKNKDSSTSDSAAIAERNRRISQLISSGSSVADVARRYGLSPETVKTIAENLK